jgi:hypothetical protein
VVAILRAGNKLAMVHLGDSRGYLMRDGVLSQVTTDHTFVQHLVDIGRITPEEAEVHPQRSVVMRVLGDFDPDVAPDLSVREARVGDRWLLCSDGLSGFVSADTIEETLATIEDVDTCADRLVQLALRAGGGDNITVVLADVIELDDVADGKGPTTHASIVGAAATTRNDPTAADDGPAARAANLTKAPREEEAEPEQVSEDEDEEEPEPGRRWGLVIGWVVGVLVVLAGIGLTVAWLNTQYYVGVDGNEITIFRGVPQSLGPIELSSPVEHSGTDVDDLRSAYLRERVLQTIQAGSLDDARQQVDMLQDDTSS